VNLFVVVAVLALLVVVLALLSRWQEKIDELEREEVIAELQEAKELGTDKPLNQHPQIDADACIGCGNCVAACPEEGVLGMVDGIARVIHGARCIGHGRCAEVCPVAAVKIGLGDLAFRPDMPIVSESFESSEAGIWIAGELGGFALIRVAVEQGTRAIENIAASRSSRIPTSDPSIADVLIVGAGPAGLAATLAAVEHGLSYITIDQDDIGGTVRKYPRRKLTLTGKLSLPLFGPVRRTEFLKEELIQFWERIIADFRLEMRTGVKFLGAERTSDGFIAQTSEGPMRARNILLALGRRGSPRKLDVPGEDQEKVLYQLLDAASHCGEQILVVGGGDSAVEAATALASQPGNVVTLSYRKRHFFRLKKRNAERAREFAESGRLRVVFESAVRSIEKDAVTLLVKSDGIESERRLKNDAVFVFAGGEPPYPLLRGLSIRFAAEAPPVVVDAENPGRAVEVLA
jgi:thioredoxin reductase (NADPH)